MNLVEQTKHWLANNHIVVPDDWLEACTEWIQEENQGRNLTSDETHSLVYEQWLLSDLHELNGQCLPAELAVASKFELSGTYAVQIDSVLDVGLSYYSQQQKVKGTENANSKVTAEEPSYKPWEQKPTRMLMLKLTDGKQVVQGMEHKPISCVTPQTVPGTKVLLHGNILCRYGVLMLSEANIKNLGGEVDTLAETNSVLNTLQSAMEESAELANKCHRQDFQGSEVRSTKTDVKHFSQAPSFQERSLSQQGTSRQWAGTHVKTELSSQRNAGNSQQHSKSRYATSSIKQNEREFNDDFMEDIDFDDDFEEACMQTFNKTQRNNTQTQSRASGLNYNQSHSSVRQTNQSRNRNNTQIQSTSEYTYNQSNTSSDRHSDNQSNVAGTRLQVNQSSSLGNRLHNIQTDGKKNISKLSLPSTNGPVKEHLKGGSIQTDKLGGGTRNIHGYKGSSENSTSSPTNSSRQLNSSGPSNNEVDFDDDFCDGDDDLDLQAIEEAESRNVQRNALTKHSGSTTSHMQKGFSGNRLLGNTEIVNNFKDTNKTGAGVAMSAISLNEANLTRSENTVSRSTACVERSSVNSIDKSAVTPTIKEEPSSQKRPADVSADPQGSNSLCPSPSKVLKIKREQHSVLKSEAPLDVDGASPFTYLSKIMASPVQETPTYHTVKAYISTLTGNLSSKDNKWSLSCKINDGTLAVDVDLSTQVLTEMIGFSPQEAQEMKKRMVRDPSVKAILKDGLQQCQQKLIELIYLMEIEISSRNPRPVIVATKQLTTK